MNSGEGADRYYQVVHNKRGHAIKWSQNIFSPHILVPYNISFSIYLNIK